MEEIRGREKDIQELCNQVLLTRVIPESGDCGYTYCPYCYHEGSWDSDTVDEIDHNPNCAYLIAKDLKTNIS